MGMKRPFLHSELFTLRLWREWLNDEQFEWRGEVRNTSNGEIHYFRDWRMLSHILPGMLAEEPDAYPPDDVDPDP